jgi:hypothetical protein
MRLIAVLALAALFARPNSAGADILKAFFITLGVLAWLGVVLAMHLAFVVAALPPVPMLN